MSTHVFLNMLFVFMVVSPSLVEIVLHRLCYFCHHRVRLRDWAASVANCSFIVKDFSNKENHSFFYKHFATILPIFCTFLISEDHTPDTGAGLNESIDATEETLGLNESIKPIKKSHPEKNPKILGGLLSFLGELLLIILIVWSIRTFIATPFQVEGNSMDDTLHDGEKIFINKIATYTDNYGRGDIIVFRPPQYKMMVKSGPICWIKQRFSDTRNLRELCGLEPQHYVKRIIGIAGDTVEVREGSVFLTPADGEKEELEEAYLNAENEGNTCFANLTCASPKDTDGYEFVVPEGKVFVLGDNRRHSSDSRSSFEIGSAFNNNGEPDPFVPLENIVGTVKVVIWPMSDWKWLSRGE